MRHLIITSNNRRFLRESPQEVREALSGVGPDENYLVSRLPDLDTVNGSNVTHEFR